jgi:hypothetical protein
MYACIREDRIVIEAGNKSSYPSRLVPISFSLLPPFVTLFNTPPFQSQQRLYSVAHEGRGKWRGGGRKKGEIISFLCPEMKTPRVYAKFVSLWGGGQRRGKDLCLFRSCSTAMIRFGDTFERKDGEQLFPVEEGKGMEKGQGQGRGV